MQREERGDDSSVNIESSIDSDNDVSEESHGVFTSESSESVEMTDDEDEYNN